MKKSLLFITLLAVAFTVSSCNSKTRDWGVTSYASLESGGIGTNYIVLPDGIKLVPAAGTSLRIPNISGSLSRERVFTEWYYIEGAEEPDENGQLAVEFLQIEPLATDLPDELGTVGYNDPVLNVSTLIQNEWQGLTPDATIVQNYLDIGFYYLAYTKNSTSESGTYAPIKHTVEFDPELKPGPVDTVCLKLRFFSNRDESEEILKGVVSYNYFITDLEPVINRMGLTLADEDKKYILRLEYDVYETPANPEDEKVKTLRINKEWTPGKPYNTVN